TEIEVQSAPRNSRANEIIVIGLVATALLLGLCLASYHPNDPSWNAAGEITAQNWIGAVGANVAAAFFQAIGLASYLIPFLILAASFNAGGLSGAVISRVLVAELNTIGAAILLFAIAATGILLTTNFSFARFYERLIQLFRTRFAILRAMPQRFRAWRITRSERRQLRRRQKAERAAARNSFGTVTGPQVVNSEGRPVTASSGGAADVILEGADLASAFESFSAATRTKTMAAAAGAATAPAKKSSWLGRG